MDGVSVTDLSLFIAGAFAAAFVTGLAGFAFAIVARRLGCISCRRCKLPR